MGDLEGSFLLGPQALISVPSGAEPPATDRGGCCDSRAQAVGCARGAPE